MDSRLPLRSFAFLEPLQVLPAGSRPWRFHLPAPAEHCCRLCGQWKPLCVKLQALGSSFSFAMLFGNGKEVPSVHSAERGTRAERTVGLQSSVCLFLGVGISTGIQQQGGLRSAPHLLLGLPFACCQVPRSYANEPFKKINYLDGAILWRIAPDPV